MVEFMHESQKSLAKAMFCKALLDYLSASGFSDYIRKALFI